MSRRLGKDRVLFYPSVHLPRVGLLLEFVLFATLAGVLTSYLPNPIHVMGLLVALGMTVALLFWQDRTLCYPRLEVTGEELRYRDAHGERVILAASVTAVSGGTCLTVETVDGSSIEFPAFAATQLELARGQNTYPDRTARQLKDFLETRGTRSVSISEPLIPSGRRRSARIVMISMLVSWGVVIVVELLRR